MFAGLATRCLCLAAIVTILFATQSATAQQKEGRVALVIGNGAYSNAPVLRNSVNDARAITKALKSAGFDVILRENVSRRDLSSALRELASRLAPGGVGLFYYAGHGLQVRGSNYLVPVDAVLASEFDIKYETLDVNDVLVLLDEARVRLNLVILDACRDNPFSRRWRSGSRGLAQIDAPRGTVIAYATAPGETAADGDGDNGLYTSELLKAMAIPGLALEDIFKKTLDGVARRSANKQVPWVSSSFRGEFYLLPASVTKPSPEMSRISEQDREYAAWMAVASSSDSRAFELFLDRFPHGTYADFARQRLQDLNSKAEKPPAERRPSDSELTAAARKSSEAVEAALNLDQPARQRIQVALSSVGFDTRGVDGMFGPRTREMIAAWQKARGRLDAGFLTASDQQTLLQEGSTAVANYDEGLRKKAIEATAQNTPRSLAIAGFPANGAGANVASTLRSNLASSGRLRLASAGQVSADLGNYPAFNELQAMGVAYLLVATFTQSTDRIEIAYRLWDVGAGRQIRGERMTTEASNWYQLANRLSDIVHKDLTGSESDFETAPR